MSDTKLLSYAEIAAALGIGGNSARALVRRKRWQRKPGNDGHARIEVPVEYLAEHASVKGDDRRPSSTPSSTPSVSPAGSPAEGGAIATLERVIRRLERQVETRDGVIDGLRRDLDDERAR